MSDAQRSRFERLYRSMHGDRHDMTRTYLGYASEIVNRAFFFWQSGLESGAA